MLDSLFVDGFLPGTDFQQRAAFLTHGGDRRAEVFAALPARFNGFLDEIVTEVRARFGGPVGYCSLPFERVDWSIFDWVATDAGYRSTEDDATFRAGLRALRQHDKPVAITEFGCTTHRGAAAKGGHGSDIVEYDGPVPRALDGDYERDEQEQADHLLDVLGVFDAEWIDAAFVYTFATFHLPRRAGPRADLDLASAGLVAVVESGSGATPAVARREPKAAFTAYAACTPTG